MTIPSTSRKAGPLLGTGAQTAWPFTFKVFAASDIAVTIADSLGIETALVLDTDYSVTLNANQETSPGGTVTYPISGSPLAVGSKLSIIGDLDYDQPLDLPSGGNFSPLALENQLDRMTMQLQQLEERLSRALLVPVNSTADVQLPNPEANELIGWDSTGDNLANYALSELATGIAYGTMRFDTFVGDGTTTQFALTEDPAALANLDVSIAGVTQVPGTDYTLTSATLVFTSAPANGVAILARYGRALPIVGPTDSSAVTHVASGAGAVPTTVQAKLRESVSVKDFGAVGDGVTDDTAAIQKAIDYAGALGKLTEVIVPSGSTYILSVDARTGIAAGVAGLVMRDYVTLVINGTLKAKAGIYGVGTLSALIKSPDVGNSFIAIKGTGLIDGNKASQTASVQCDNIYLRAVYQVSVNGIKCDNANGNGILIDKAVGGANHVDVSVTDTMVSNCNTIGIQVSHSAANLVISGNQVTSCADNCIDVYNENGTVTADPGIITINGNTVSGGLVGIFPETTQNCSVIGNAIGNCTVGIQTNRINGAPTNIVLSGNTIYNCPTGIVGSGDTKGVLITGNSVSAFNTAGISLIGTTVSAYVVHGNTFIPSATTTPIISLNGTTFIWNQVFNNVCEDPSHDVTKGIVLVAGTIGANTFEPIIYSQQIRPVKVSSAGSTASGGTLAITVPAWSAGKLLVKSAAGGAWASVWSGSFVSDGTQVKVAQESSTFTTPGNNVVSVTVTGSSLVITVNWAASGSAGNYNYWLEYFTQS